MPVVFPRRTRKPISLTALIDVVFILLMFFMLTSSFDHMGSLTLMQNGITSDADSAELTPVIVLHADGRFSRDGTGTRFKLEKHNAAERIDLARPIVVIPTAQTQVQEIVTALIRLKDLGLSAVSLGEPIDAQ